MKMANAKLEPRVQGGQGMHTDEPRATIGLPLHWDNSPGQGKTGTARRCLLAAYSSGYSGVFFWATSEHCFVARHNHTVCVCPSPSRYPYTCRKKHSPWCVHRWAARL